MPVSQLEEQKNEERAVQEKLREFIERLIDAVCYAA